MLHISFCIRLDGLLFLEVDVVGVLKLPAVEGHAKITQGRWVEGGHGREGK